MTQLLKHLEILTPLLSPSAVGKALDGRPRPQKQLSQPTLGASEHMEAGRLRGSQSSEGSELIHSTSVNTSSPNSATYNSDSSRDTDMGKLLNNFIKHNQYKTEGEMVSKFLPGGTPTSGPPRLSDGLQSDPLDGLPYPATHFDLYSLDQLQEDDRESDRCFNSHSCTFASLHEIIYFKH